MEEHIHEKFVVVESNAISDPWAVVVHLKDASVALGAVMASVWLCLVAPLADADTPIAFAFYGGLQTHNRFRLRLLTGACLLIRLVRGDYKRTFCCFQIFEIFMYNFSWLLLTLFN